MKKILLVIALVASVTVARAQQPKGKSLSAAKADVEAAKKVSEDPKKATKVDTWLKLGQAYMNAYYAPQKSGWLGASEAELTVVMAKEKCYSTKKVMIQGQEYTRKQYQTVNYYYSPKGVLEIMEVTKPLYRDVLDRALKAYVKAGEVDVKHKKTKQINAAIKDISEKYIDDAYNAYRFEKFTDASKYFEAAARASAKEPYAVLDTNSIYNAALTAYLAIPKAKEEAKPNLIRRSEKLFNESVDKGYYNKDGEAFAKLAELAMMRNDTIAKVNYLEKGFKMFPQSQSILISLINHYMTTGGDVNRLFELIDAAKKNEPNNASLYYVEGDARIKLGQVEEGLAAFAKCAEINPNYEYGYIGIALYYYNRAVEIQDEAAKVDIRDYKTYDRLMGPGGDFEVTLKKCIEPFEKAFGISKDEEIKKSMAEYIKNACFRFRSEEEYKQKLDKYNAYLGK
ncbi:MAG: hypothetical protein J5632_05175 [Bacteroidales bacterium]|nr:hypothetical protein [Bacteroidales bacterium]